MRASFVVLCFVLFAACGQSSNEHQVFDTVPVKVKVDSSRKNLILPKAMNIVRNSAYDTFFLRLKDSVYYCTYKGKMHSADSMGENRRFLFDLESEYIIDEIYFYPIEQSRFFVAWQETNYVGIRSYFAVYKRGSAKPEWKRVEPAPAPGQPVIDSNSLYITTLGMIGKLHLDNGQPYWIHDSLFNPIKITFKQFERPLLYTSTVCFFDMPVKGKKAKRDSIWVDDNSGKIIR